jgi:hypothetical protein
MKKMNRFIVAMCIVLLAGCTGGSQKFQGLSGIQFSNGLTQAEIDEQAQTGQMRDIR